MVTFSSVKQKLMLFVEDASKSLVNHVTWAFQRDPFDRHFSFVAAVVAASSAHGPEDS